jgi:hypothetical protein
MSHFDLSSLTNLAAHYPESPVMLWHDLAEHPLLRLEALAELAERMRPEDVEYNRGDLPIGIDPENTPANGLSAAETVRRIEQCGSWMVLKFIEQDDAYRALLEEALAGIESVVRPVTGEMLKREGFIFVSSPGAVTPFHFDPEHNILLQIRGRKTMTVFGADDHKVVPPALHEKFHRGGHRNLPWDDGFAQAGVPHELTPGDALYVPVKAPHWVKNGAEPSVSLSITWRSEWSFHEAYAHGMNHLLRGIGVEPAAPKRFPHRNLVKSAAYRAVSKVRPGRGKSA